MKTLIAV